MTTQRILAVDDEESILKALRYALEQAGFEVHTAVDAKAAAFLFEEIDPDLMVVDVMLPGKSGLDLAREIRETSDVPIIILSARGDEIDRVLGLEFGADDYVTKPFSPRELVSRVKAILRRVDRGSGGQQKISIGDLVVDPDSRQVFMRGEPVHLTTSEYGILTQLGHHAGKAFSRAELLAALWDEEPVGDERAIDVHIHNMREKLEADPKDPEYLLTVRGFGYRLREA
ncbi:MAG: response regulator transcription factor [Actinobacteria bacterium]|nr:MAG: response regulator transcription factor [Actinomycetota bacterium]